MSVCIFCMYVCIYVCMFVSKYDFVWAGNCNLINTKVLMLFLPNGVLSECEVLPLKCFGGSVFPWH